MSPSQSQFAHVVATAADIAANYAHFPKQVVPGTAIESAAATLKWYALHPEDERMPEEITLLARARLTAAPLEARGLGFVILHRCERNFYFLIVCTWRNSNELWETVLYKDGDAMPHFEIFPRDAAHKPTFCVWELFPVWHEQQAWLRFLNSARDVPAAHAWLHDLYVGSA